MYNTNPDTYLSFIIACYNAEKYLDRTIQSVYKNNWLSKDNIEVICINDGSTDGTLAKLKQLAKSYPITILDQPNRGVGVTKNRGLEAAQGQYVMILDADDWVDAKVISESLDFAIKNKIDLMAFEMQFVNENLEYTHLKNIFPGPKETLLTGAEVVLAGYQPSSVCLFLMHSKFFKDYGMCFYEGTQLDVELSTRLMLRSKRVFFSKHVGYYYFRNEGSITKAVNQDKLKSYLYDSVRIAELGKNNVNLTKDRAIKTIVIQNNNSIVWNLLWRFLSKPKEVDFNFKLQCIKELKEKNLYPIKGPLKTWFQRLTRAIMNIEFLLKWVVKL